MNKKLFSLLLLLSFYHLLQADVLPARLDGKTLLFPLTTLANTTFVVPFHELEADSTYGLRFFNEIEGLEPKYPIKNGLVKVLLERNSTSCGVFDKKSKVYFNENTITINGVDLETIEFSDSCLSNTTDFTLKYVFNEGYTINILFTKNKLLFYDIKGEPVYSPINIHPTVQESEVWTTHYDLVNNSSEPIMIHFHKNNADHVFNFGNFGFSSNLDSPTSISPHGTVQITVFFKAQTLTYYQNLLREENSFEREQQFDDLRLQKSKNDTLTFFSSSDRSITKLIDINNDKIFEFRVNATIIKVKNYWLFYFIGGVVLLGLLFFFYRKHVFIKTTEINIEEESVLEELITKIGNKSIDRTAISEENKALLLTFLGEENNKSNYSLDKNIIIDDFLQVIETGKYDEEYLVFKKRINQLIKPKKTEKQIIERFVSDIESDKLDKYPEVQQRIKKITASKSTESVQTNKSKKQIVEAFIAAIESGDLSAYGYTRNRIGKLIDSTPPQKKGAEKDIITDFLTALKTNDLRKYDYLSPPELDDLLVTKKNKEKILEDFIDVTDGLEKERDTDQYIKRKIGSYSMSLKERVKTLLEDLQVATLARQSFGTANINSLSKASNTFSTVALERRLLAALFKPLKGKIAKDTVLKTLIQDESKLEKQVTNIVEKFEQDAVEELEQHYKEKIQRLEKDYQEELKATQLSVKINTKNEIEKINNNLQKVKEEKKRLIKEQEMINADLQMVQKKFDEQKVKYEQKIKELNDSRYNIDPKELHLLQAEIRQIKSRNEALENQIKRLKGIISKLENQEEQQTKKISQFSSYSEVLEEQVKELQQKEAKFIKQFEEQKNQIEVLRIEKEEAKILGKKEVREFISKQIGVSSKNLDQSLEDLVKSKNQSITPTFPIINAALDNILPDLLNTYTSFHALRKDKPAFIYQFENILIYYIYQTSKIVNNVRENSLFAAFIERISQNQNIDKGLEDVYSVMQDTTWLLKQTKQNKIQTLTNKQFFETVIQIYFMPYFNYLGVLYAYTQLTVRPWKEDLKAANIDSQAVAIIYKSVEDYFKNFLGYQLISIQLAKDTFNENIHQLGFKSNIRAFFRSVKYNRYTNTVPVNTIYDINEMGYIEIKTSRVIKKAVVLVR